MSHTMFMRQSDNRPHPYREYKRGAVTAIARRYSDTFSCVDLFVGGAFVASVSGNYAPSVALRECRIAWESAEDAP